MENQPLSSNEHVKLFIFSLLVAPSVILGAGILPVIFLVFGIYMMRKNQDFSHIDIAVKYIRIYLWLALIFCIAASLVNGLSYMFSNSRYSSEFGIIFILFILLSIITLGYLFVLNILFYIPLKKHRKWVIANGVFSSTPRTITQEENTHKVNEPKFKSLSNELIKLAKLKKAGFISEGEFLEAKKKLLVDFTM